MVTLRAVQYQRLPSPSPSLTSGNSAESGYISANAGLHDHDQDHDQDFDDVDNVFRMDGIDTDDGPSIDDTPESACRFTSSSSFFLSQSSAHDNGGDEQDFIHLLTGISRIYRIYKRGTYLKMMNMDTNEWQKLGQGFTFSVSSSGFTFPTQTVSSKDHRIVDQVSNKLVIKRVALMESAQIRSFVHELRVLDHLSTNPFIVDLCAVG